MQPRAGRQGQEIDARRGDVLPEIASLDHEALCPQFVEEFGVDQMHLAQIGLCRIFADARTMLDRLAHMRVAGDAEALQEAYAETRRLAEMVAGANTDGND